MASEERPQINLITPPSFDLETFPAQLAAVMDAVDIACLRITLATRDEMELIRAADAMRDTRYLKTVPRIRLGCGAALFGVCLMNGEGKPAAHRVVITVHHTVTQPISLCVISRDISRHLTGSAGRRRPNPVHIATTEPSRAEPRRAEPSRAERQSPLT